MGRYLDIVGKGQRERPERSEPLTAKEANLAKEGIVGAGGNLGDLRSLPPDELAKLDIRFRIVAPDEADGWTIYDWLEWIAERSSILEFDGGQSREQAESEAFVVWRLYRYSRGA